MFSHCSDRVKVILNIVLLGHSMVLKTLYKNRLSKTCCGLGAAILAVLWPFCNGLAQEELLDKRWLVANSPHFTVYSQLSSRQTSELLGQLESWREVAAHLIRGDAGFPAANVPNYVYLFSKSEDFQYFASGEETAFFYATPRANFMAFMPGDESSLKAAKHQYAHFLLKNFYDLRIPRWYEEGMASYLSRVSINRDKAQLERVTEQTHEIMAAVNSELSMDRFLYRDEALASPRLIQIANLKSESLLHYFLHGYQEDRFVDRRKPLTDYLEFLFAGRNQRFAFDQSFDVTTRQLDEEFELYLTESRRPRGVIEIDPLQPVGRIEPITVDSATIALMLGELALNSGGVEKAELFFSKIIESDEPIARAYSGLGDALRFQSLAGRDQEIARYFELALEIAPENPDILLDYGEYWESELQDCDKIYPAAQRQYLMDEIKLTFLKAIELRQDSAEAELALAEYYLLEGQDWEHGLPYQQRAFELLPADGFIMEVSVKYAIAAQQFEEAERLIAELSQPTHFFGEPDYVTALREQLMAMKRGEVYNACSN